MLYHNQNKEVYSDSRTVTDEMNSLNILIGGGLGYKLNIFEQDFRIKICYSHGLSRVPKDQTYIAPDGHLSGWAEWRTREINLTLEYVIL